MLRIAGNSAKPEDFTLMPAAFTLLGNKRFASAFGDAPVSARLSNIGARLSYEGDGASLQNAAPDPDFYTKSKTSGRGGSCGRGQPDEEGEVGRAAPGAVYCLVDACHVLITRPSPRLTTKTGASRKATCSNVATPERRTESDCWQSSLRTRTSTRMCGTGCYLP